MRSMDCLDITGLFEKIFSRKILLFFSLLLLAMIGLTSFVSAHPPKLADPFGGSINVVYSDKLFDRGATIQLHLNPLRDFENVTIEYVIFKKSEKNKYGTPAKTGSRRNHQYGKL